MSGCSSSTFFPSASVGVVGGESVQDNIEITIAKNVLVSFVRTFYVLG
jgi:hypothetical protein